ncbi:DUF1799 domain-containing protein [Yersinia rohdei]|uniref:DUF1799 domain-containing protein n=1 Tax=Yersinia rohdei TaxID=29485 RepID=UPI0025AB1849|nr:DUF1799 domain-containing protein [Yersinia rohdei]MDN0096559.1 DUF1799 domain-containing protein [Yersinia rohdei]
MAGNGLTPDDFDDVIIEIWQDVWPAFNVIRAMSTQWRTGMSGPTGLDYGCLSQVMDWVGVESKATVFDDIRHMESVALSVIHKRSK